MARISDNDASRGISRRSLFRQVAAAGAAAVAGTPLAPDEASAQEHTAQGNPVATAQREALETLTAAEADTLEAICARLIPSDENGPGAAEARAAHYIDRALTGPLRASRAAYAAGLAAIDVYAQGSKGAAFVKLEPRGQDAVLTEMEKNVATGFWPDAATFFALVRAHTIQGTFCRRLAADAGGPRRGWARSRHLADAARLRARRATQQFPRLAAVRPESQHRNPHPSAKCVGALFATASYPSDDERGRRHVAALLGAKLAAQSVGFPGGERDHAAVRRLAHPQGHDRRGLAVRA